MQPSTTSQLEPRELPPFLEWRQVPSLVGSLRTRSLVACPRDLEQCREALVFCRERGLTVCVRGAGQGYGDVALNDGQVLLDSSGMNRILEIDQANAQITVEGGTRLIEIYRAVHYRLLTLASSPTAWTSSVAGAISANVNGKDGWRHGSFGQQVVRFTLLLASGETKVVERCDPLFAAVVGGLGLLGVIVDATLQLLPIPSPYVEIERIPVADSQALVDELVRVEESYDFVVAWMDVYAKGPATGRAVIHAARWKTKPPEEHMDQLAVEARRRYLEQGYRDLERHRRFGLSLHDAFGPLLSLMLHVQRPLVRWFNRFYYLLNWALVRLGRRRKTELFVQYSFAASFTVPPAHLVCGPRGYTVQLTFPRAEAKAAIDELMAICQSSPSPPVTTVLRVHVQDDALISFSEDGYSLNLEIHPKKRQEAASRDAVDRLIEATIQRGGKVHMTKDQVLRPEQFRRLYPRHRQLLALKHELDPHGLFASDLARRVGLHPALGG